VLEKTLAVHSNSSLNIKTRLTKLNLMASINLILRGLQSSAGAPGKGLQVW